VLYANYSFSSQDEAEKVSMIAEAKELFIRVKEYSRDIDLRKFALHMEAKCELLLGNPNEIIDLLEDVNLSPPNDLLLSQAYFMTGKVFDAKIILQRSICEYVLKIIDSIPLYLHIYADDPGCFEEAYKRTMEFIHTFHLEKLAPASVMPFYLAAAGGYLAYGNAEKSLEILEVYANLVTSDIYPLKMLNDDSFFDLINSSMEKLTFGAAELPRDEQTIKQSMADAVIANPAFSVLLSDPRFKSRFKNVMDKLKNNVGGNQ
jgi:tetratricopeptide (TPR) repeat protein